MLSVEVSSRLEALNRAPFLPAPMTPPNDASAPRRAEGEPRAAGATLVGEEIATDVGRVLRIRRPLGELWRDAPAELPVAASAGSGESGASDELARLADAWRGGCVFLDLETCGFAGSAIFLVGLIHRAAGGIVLDQLLARNYTEEKALLTVLWSLVGRNEVLVTFNGKSFDWPMVHDRSTVHHLGRDRRGGRTRRIDAAHPPATPSTRQPPPEDAPPIAALGRREPRPELLHVDLLHHARRRWRSELPDCKLQTLERFVCRRYRRDDIPGGQIPREYHHFVRTGDVRGMRVILHHNALDLVTLAQLAARLATV